MGCPVQRLAARLVTLRSALSRCKPLLGCFLASIECSTRRISTGTTSTPARRTPYVSRVVSAIGVSRCVAALQTLANQLFSYAYKELHAKGVTEVPTVFVNSERRLKLSLDSMSLTDLALQT